MPRHIIIDGYNLLFAIGRSPHQADRDYLLCLLDSYRVRKDVAITVVFDRKTGNPSEGKQFLATLGGVKIIFTAPAQEADEIIRQLVEVAANPKNLLVVSSDKAGVSKYCRKIGSEIMSSLEFYDFLGRQRQNQKGFVSSSGEEDEKPPLCQADIEYYLEKFSKKK